jgi:hypothetical protein
MEQSTERNSKGVVFLRFRVIPGPQWKTDRQSVFRSPHPENCALQTEPWTCCSARWFEAYGGSTEIDGDGPFRRGRSSERHGFPPKQMQKPRQALPPSCMAPPEYVTYRQQRSSIGSGPCISWSALQTTMATSKGEYNVHFRFHWRRSWLGFRFLRRRLRVPLRLALIHPANFSDRRLGPSPGRLFF